MEYIALREDLMNLSIQDNQKTIATIKRVNKIWPTEDAPTTTFLGEGIVSFPIIQIGEKSFTIHRRLLTNHVLANDYEIWVEDEKRNIVAKCTTFAYRWTSMYSFSGKSFQLRRNNLFSFDYTFEGEDLHLSLRDTTPFFSFSSKRNFSIDTDKTVDPLLLTLVFFIAHYSFFR